ncbi:RHS repeat-associated core domain-containing protein [Paenibacillus bouchesdurhonensis]|uniref:RHS repeat-associated core domain-containing protein n=1 Tax=Paenibacillus bouchesdurhonensis TaxID=1870990 RepID=UPI000DA62CD0|nr:RHS repeat-associated core domain-containing protein [Paenibacillus bouchesdurhonensis]
MRIEVEIPSLKQTGRELKRTANELESMQSSLQRSMSRLTLESRSRSDVDSTFRQIDQRLTEIRRELEELSRQSTTKGEQFSEADGKGRSFTQSKAWKFIKTGTSMALDFVPVVGNAKGIIEAVIGRDLITGEKLAPWERGLAVLGPLGKGTRNAAKLVKFADEAVDGISVLARNSDTVADAVKQGERAVDAAADAKTATKQATETAGHVKGGDEVASAMNRSDSVSQAGKTGDRAANTAEELTSAKQVSAAEGSIQGMNRAGKNIDAAHGSDQAIAAAVGAGAGGTAAAAASLASKGNKTATAAKEAPTSKGGSNSLEAGQHGGGGGTSASKSKTDSSTMDNSNRNTESCVEDPIHTATGQQFIVHPALKLYGAGIWQFELYYHSGLLQASELGTAWTHNYAMKLEETGPNGTDTRRAITVWRNASHYNVFYQEADGVFRGGDIDSKWNELYLTDKGYELRTRDRESFYFNHDGRFEQHRNRDGFLLQALYDDGRLISLKDAVTGRALNFLYNNAGLLERVYDHAREIEFTYNESRHLTQFLDPNGHCSQLTYDKDGRIITLMVAGEIQFINTFDSEHRIIAQEDGKGAISRLSYDTDSKPGYTITTLIDALGHERQFVHDTNHLLIEITEPDGTKREYTYNEWGQETARINAMGEKITREYDPQGRLVAIIDPSGSRTSYTYNSKHLVVQEIDALGGVTAYEYDEQDRLLSVTRPDSTFSKYTYDSKGLRIAYQDFSGAVTKYHYQDTGELSGIEDAEGRMFTVAHDDAGRVNDIQDPLGGQTKRLYDANDNLVMVTDPIGRTWSFAYDANDHLIEEKKPSGATIKYTYNAAGQMESTEDALGHTDRYTYDNEGRLVEHTNSIGATTRLVYDSVGRLSTVTDPLGRELAYTYDKAGRLLSVVDAEGQQIQALTYDMNGNPVAVTNALGHTTHRRFNALRQLIEEKDALGRQTELVYDAAHRVSAVIEEHTARYEQSFDAMDRLASYMDSNGNRTMLRYDQTGLLVEEKNAAEMSLVNSYDERGWLINRSNARGQNTEYRYDAAGQVVEVKDEAGQISLEYDLDGRVISAAEGSDQAERSYDLMGRLIESRDPWGHRIRYSYDALGQLTHLTYPDGKIVEYRYNAAGELSEVKDWRGRLTRYKYDDNGRVINTVRPNGSTEQRSYDAAGQLLRIKDASAQGVMLQDLRYVYNEIGQIIMEDERQYTYDNLRRLRSGSWPGRRFHYTYDLGGNITESGDSSSDVKLNMSYGSDNRLAKVGIFPVEMDRDGNLLYMTDGEIMEAYEYDARNRLCAAGKARYRYNWKGDRISLTWRGTTTRYVIDDRTELSQVLMELHEDGTPKAFYVYGHGLIGREDEAGNYLSYHSDLRGSTTLLTDEHGRVRDRYTYDPYGKIESHEGDTRQPFQYNGRDGVMTDPNGLYYMRARYYHPVLKRFLNRDVIRGDLQDGQTFNRYAYVNGDPVRYIDPLGLMKQDCPRAGKGDTNPSKPAMSFEEALEKLNESNLRPGQTVISKSRVMEIVDNYDPIKAQSSIFSNGKTSYLVEGHHTTVASVMFGRGNSFNMNYPTLQIPSATNVYWTKKWYEFWKTSIKVLD